MPKYCVQTREVWVQGYSVFADSPEEAILKVNSDSEDEDVTLLDSMMEYSHMLEPDTWDCTEIKDTD